MAIRASHCSEARKARYTLATKLKSTQTTLLKVDCCRNRQQIGNNHLKHFFSQSTSVHSASEAFALYKLMSYLLTYLLNEVDCCRNRQQIGNKVDCCVCTERKQHGRLRRLSTKSTVLNSTLSPVCTGLNNSAERVIRILSDIYGCCVLILLLYLKFN